MTHIRDLTSTQLALGDSEPENYPELWQPWWETLHIDEMQELLDHLSARHLLLERVRRHSARIRVIRHRGTMRLRRLYERDEMPYAE